ncbi:hypothetical protein AB0L00_43355 [Actinoallomurus sp. NPDC052308]|uniref:hypothetical protein n=1 Tax=Actinoallomurus sp. NPDC052308 TaxID=3155530 RepID=UPI00342B597B
MGQWVQKVRRAEPVKAAPSPATTLAATSRGPATDILAAIVRAAIEAHRDPQAHRQALTREQAERRAIREGLNR